jgi:hypothetical protein
MFFFSMTELQMLYVWAFCHTTYQYDNPFRSKHIRACPRQHFQQPLWCFALDHLHFQEVEGQKPKT